MKKILVLTSSILFMSGVFAKPPVRLYFLINIESCSGCNVLSGNIRKYPDIFKETTFLFSNEETNIEQARGFMGEILGAYCTIDLDAKMYKKLSSSISFFKFPYLLVSDSAGNVLFKTPVDSLGINIETIRKYIRKVAVREERTYSDDRLRQLIGSKSINKIGDFIFVTAYQHRGKVYYYDLRNHQLDSICLTYERLDSLLREVKIDGIKTAELDSFYKRLSMPYSVQEFSAYPYSDNNYFYTDLSIQYMDLRHIPDTISPKWEVFLLSFDPFKKKLKGAAMVPYQSGADYNSSKSRLDYAYKKYINDSTWIVGGDQTHENSYTKVKLLMTFQPDHTTRKLSFSGKLRALTVDSAVSFRGTKLSNTDYRFLYGYLDSMLFFNAAPIVYNSATGNSFNVLAYDTAINWIYDISRGKDHLHVLTQKNQQFFLLTLSNKDYSLISTETIPKTCRSNAVLESKNIYYMDKDGIIHASTVDDR